MPPGPRPIPVSIGVYLIDFEKIDELTLTQTIVGYLMLSWHDPRLAKGLAPELDRSAVSLDDIWNPDVEVINQHTPRSIANWVITINDEGTVVYEERFTAELSSDFDLRRFPFDSQRLRMVVESFRYEETDMKFISRAQTTLRNPAAFLPDWSIENVGERFDTDLANPDAHPYAQYNYEIQVKRKRGYYVWNVFLPLGFITLLAWAVFFIAPDDVSTRTTIAITALLTAIAFSLVVSGTRPRVSYLTYMDAVFLNVLLPDFRGHRCGDRRSFLHPEHQPSGDCRTSVTYGAVQFPGAHRRDQRRAPDRLRAVRAAGQIASLLSTR